MKRIVSYLTSLVILGLVSSCGNTGNGELIGRSNGENWHEPDPFGMLFIERGSYTMGPNDQDAHWALNSQSRTVSLDNFWMDETEITNDEYRQFVRWVKDSIIYLNLARNIEDYAAKDEEGNTIEYIDNVPKINYREKIDMRDEQVREIVNEIRFDKNRHPFMPLHPSITTLNYTYSWIDYNQASLKRNKFDPLKGGYTAKTKAISDQINSGADSSSLFVKKDTFLVFSGDSMENITKHKWLTNWSDFVMTKNINVYPDTLCWTRDYTYAYNEPYMKMYFSHPGYGEYPVVGISWEQATAFCHWRTKLKNDYQVERGDNIVQDYRLPMEAEWEYAARGARDLAMYPWGGPYTRRANGCFLANFKVMRGNYTDDGHLIAAPVASYPPNDYGLYDMSGNVAEWTSTAYSEASYSFVHDMNPNYQFHAKEGDKRILKRKVVRGGSWKDIAYFLQNGTRTYEYQDESRPYIGFRCVRSFIGPE